MLNGYDSSLSRDFRIPANGFSAMRIGSALVTDNSVITKPTAKVLVALIMIADLH